MPRSKTSLKKKLQTCESKAKTMEHEQPRGSAMQDGQSLACLLLQFHVSVSATSDLSQDFDEGLGHLPTSPVVFDMCLI